MFNQMNFQLFKYQEFSGIESLESWWRVTFGIERCCKKGLRVLRVCHQFERVRNRGNKNLMHWTNSWVCHVCQAQFEGQSMGGKTGHRFEQKISWYLTEDFVLPLHKEDQSSEICISQVKPELKAFAPWQFGLVFRLDLRNPQIGRPLPWIFLTNNMWFLELCVCVFFVWSRNCMVNIVLDTQYTILIQFDCPFVIAPNIFFQAKIWTLGKSGRPTKNGMYRYPWSPGGQRWRGCFPSNYHVPSLLESPTWGSNFWAANQTKVNINSICSIMYRHCIVMPNFRHGAKTKWSNCELFICLFAICVFVCWLRNVSRDLRNLLNIFLIK